MGNHALFAACTLLLVACTDPLSSTDATSHEAVCTGHWRCFARVRTDFVGQRIVMAAPQGLGADDLADAYALDTTADPNATIAIIDAYGYANLESDLAHYRSTYGLPACTTASGCLTIVNQQGQTSPLPPEAPANDDWTQETALDVDMASAACPRCKLLVVLADDDQGDGLFIAQGAAVALHASVISNSWGGPEDNTTSSYESYFSHAGTGIFVATGDNGYNDGGQGPDYPGTSAHVIGVGGTTLSPANNTRGWSESAWRSGGSACSQNIAKPGFQTSSACTKRMSADVSAVGDPATGLSTYNNGSWAVIGGTSAAAPLVAGIFALTRNGSRDAQFIYQHASAFHDVTSGTNGSCSSALCRAGTGWDGPTGNGTPDGAMLATLGGTGSGGGSGGGSGSGSGSGSGAGSGSDGGAGSDGTGSDGGAGSDGAGSDGGTGGNADNPDGADGSAGGCATTNGGGLASIAFALGVIVIRRRRRAR